MTTSTSRKSGRMSVVIFPIVNSPALSERIGYLAAQQRRAYNQSVDWLNREPWLKLMKSGGTGIPRHRSLQGRISELRDPKSARYDSTWVEAPRWLQNCGASLAHRAQQRFAAHWRERLYEIRRIEDRRHWWAENQPDTSQQWAALLREERRYARLTRPHRRTLAFRSRKHGTQTLEVDNNTAFTVTKDRMSIWLGGQRTGGVRIPLRRALPIGCEVRSFRLVEKRKGRMKVVNRQLASVEYEIHVTVQYPEAVPVQGPQIPLDILGVDLGVKRTWVTSDGIAYRDHGPHACHCGHLLPREDGKRGGLRHKPGCAQAKPQQLEFRIVRKRGGSSRKPHRVSKRRRKLERRRAELLRKRTADRNRVFTAHAQDILDRRVHPVRLIALPALRLAPMLTSGWGGSLTPNRNMAQKAESNRRLADAALGYTSNILIREATKRGIPVVKVDAADASRTCSRCGSENTTKSRKSQARFECQTCGWHGDADANAGAVFVFRAYQQWVDPAAVLGQPLDGGQEQSSSPLPGLPGEGLEAGKARYATPELRREASALAGARSNGAAVKVT